MRRIHCVEFSANVSLPVPFEIMACYNLPMFAVLFAKGSCVVYDVDVILFDVAPFIEDGDYRGLKLGFRRSCHGVRR